MFLMVFLLSSIIFICLFGIVLQFEIFSGILVDVWLIFHNFPAVYSIIFSIGILNFSLQSNRVGQFKKRRQRVRMPRMLGPPRMTRWSAEGNCWKWWRDREGGPGGGGRARDHERVPHGQWKPPGASFVLSTTLRTRRCLAGMGSWLQSSQRGVGPTYWSENTPPPNREVLTWQLRSAKNPWQIPTHPRQLPEKGVYMGEKPTTTVGKKQ